MFRRGGKLSILSVKDDRIKVMNERLNMTEKHFMELYAYFASCTRKLAKFRNAYDELARAVKCYAEEEDINDSLSLGLKSFTNSITILADYMDIEIHRMEAKIFNEFLQFENICKTSRENLRLAVVARDKEVLRQKQMIEIKTKFSANTSAADSELVKAKMEVNRTNKEIDEIINTFEKRKMQDIKRILNDFVLISMKYHTKALEVLTATHYDISNIDEELDLKEFQKLMKTDDEPVKPTSIRKTLRAAHSMDDLDKRASPLNSRAKLTGSARNISFEAQSGNEEDEESETDTGEEEVSNSESEDSGSDDDVTQNSIHEIEEKTHIPSFRAKKPPTSIGIPKEPVPLSRMVTVSETAIELPTAAPRQPIDCTVRKK